MKEYIEGMMVKEEKIIDIEEKLQAAREEGALGVLNWFLSILPQDDPHYSMLVKRVGEIYDDSCIRGLKPQETPNPHFEKQTRPLEDDHEGLHIGAKMDGAGDV